MAFEIFSPPILRSKKRGLQGSISLTKTRINFGNYDPVFVFLLIEFDRNARQIRFRGALVSEKNKYKVHKSNNQYHITAKRFTQSGILPLGIYKKVGHLTYELEEATNDPK